MGTKIYKNRLSGQVVKMCIPDGGGTSRTIWYGDKDAASYRYGAGQCHFEYDVGNRSLIITEIEANPEGLGLGALLLYEVTSHAIRSFPAVINVVADSVVMLARGFYLQIGFRPAISNVEMNNRLPSPGDGVNFASRYFQAKGAGAAIYQATNGLSVTRKLFSNRIEAGRNAPDWEASPLTVLARAREKSAHWEEQVP
jgi:hypothetical protein